VADQVGGGQIFDDAPEGALFGVFPFAARREALLEACLAPIFELDQLRTVRDALMALRDRELAVEQQVVEFIQGAPGERYASTPATPRWTRPWSMTTRAPTLPAKWPTQYPRRWRSDNRGEYLLTQIGLS